MSEAARMGKGELHVLVSGVQMVQHPRVFFSPTRTSSPGSAVPLSPVLAPHRL